MAPRGWRDVRRILVVRPDNIGDIILLGPALRALRRALPRARLSLLASPAGALAAPLLPWVDDVLAERVVWQDLHGALPLDPSREMALVERLRGSRFDAAFVFSSFSQSPWPAAYACYLAGIPRRVGQSRSFGGSLLTCCAAPLPDETHQAERNLHLIESAGFHVEDRRPEIVIPAEARVRVNGMLAAEGIGPRDPLIAVAPGASCAARRYDAARFGEAARAVAERTGWPVVLMGSAREADLAGPILRAGVVSLVGRTSVPEMAAVIERTGLLLANDSGPMHLAEALDRPMVILYSGTDRETQWRPRYAPALVMRRLTPCAPCYRFTCPTHMECLDIPPAEVARAALSLIPGVRKEVTA